VRSIDGQFTPSIRPSRGAQGPTGDASRSHHPHTPSSTPERQAWVPAHGTRRTPLSISFARPPPIVHRASDQTTTTSLVDVGRTIAIREQRSSTQLGTPLRLGRSPGALARWAEAFSSRPAKQPSGTRRWRRADLVRGTSQIRGAAGYRSCRGSRRPASRAKRGACRPSQDACHGVKAGPVDRGLPGSRASVDAAA
jgi:hypothetical protein